MSKKIALSTNTSKLSLTSSSPENHSPPPSAEIIASNVDLLAEILLLVPARSLIKFKSVSKRWLSLISDSRFARNHTLQNPSPLPSGLYFYSQPYGSFNDQITRVSIHDDPRTSLPNLPFLQHSGSRTRVLHSSNGLMLCSTFDSYNYVIYNLTTQKFAVLPRPVVYISYCSKFGSYLVFDPKKSPYYKVVVVSFAYDLNTSQLDVYSSESASWKSPILAPKIQYQRTGVHGAVWNGELILMSCVCGSNWESCAKHDHLYIRFDIDAEKLTTTRVPYLDSNLSQEILYFGECTDHLLLIQRSWNDPMELEVLEMMDGENYFRWNVKYVVDLTRFRLRSRSCGTFSVMSVMNIGANENDLALVLHIRSKVIQYNVYCKTLKVLCDFPRSDFYAVISPLYEYSFRFIESLMPV